MKKLIGILSISLLSASSSLNLVSCFDDETGKKHNNKKHLKKDEASDNEENEEKISDNILEKLQNLRLTAHLKANGSNTMAHLICEISNRKEIKEIVQHYDFKVTTDTKKESVLTQSSYRFTITLENDQSDAKDDNSITADFEVIVEKINKQEMLEEISEKALSKIKAVTEKYKTITTDNFINRGVWDIKNEINDELQKIKDEILELQDEKAKELYNGKWNIDITSTDRKDHSILFHEEEIKWDINLNFHELGINQVKVHENLNFSTFIDWQINIDLIFKIIDNIYNQSIASIFKWDFARNDDSKHYLIRELAPSYDKINANLKNKLLEIKKLSDINYNFSDVYNALENKVDENTKHQFYELITRFSYSSVNVFYWIKLFAKAYPDLRVNVDRKGPNDFEFTIKIKEFTHKFKPAMNILSDWFSNFSQWQGFSWLQSWLNIIMESFKYFAENELGKDSSY